MLDPNQKAKHAPDLGSIVLMIGAVIALVAISVQLAQLAKLAALAPVVWFGKGLMMIVLAVFAGRTLLSRHQPWRRAAR